MIVVELNEVTSKIIDSGISVHKFLGAGLLEKVYQECLHYELSLRGLKVQSELNMPLNYKPEFGIRKCNERAKMLKYRVKNGKLERRCSPNVIKLPDFMTLGPRPRKTVTD